MVMEFGDGGGDNDGCRGDGGDCGGDGGCGDVVV